MATLQVFLGAPHVKLARRPLIKAANEAKRIQIIGPSTFLAGITKLHAPSTSPRRSTFNSLEACIRHPQTQVAYALWSVERFSGTTSSSARTFLPDPKPVSPSSSSSPPASPAPPPPRKLRRGPVLILLSPTFLLPTST
ncbi:hypothetical protein BDN72DRAFT_299266 [Pluteus cervinus]|uniref:Uncharacterized protein n=1 Tax=Pluteus cervinus TaxID=181527 RepID=A0ACD3AGA5_9AGAR|nr:hypothetical protein BDN72DRAFT_299266 [Pluteus cervinus]